MRIVKAVTIPAQPERVEKKTEIHCSFCNVKGNGHDREIDWPTPGRGYDIEQSAVYYREGSNYPDGGSGEHYDLHVCGKCMKEKVVPALEALGAKFEKTNWDW